MVTHGKQAAAAAPGLPFENLHFSLNLKLGYLQIAGLVFEELKTDDFDELVQMFQE